MGIVTDSFGGVVLIARGISASLSKDEFDKLRWVVDEWAAENFSFSFWRLGFRFKA